ncbi:hypothetical protein CVT26_006298 [Gymnopilus dilepis]|uniref:Uncharacterized protein n=1 Tax=Gymnopilus dilepis TaxID=231916 RepID=A0A409Y0N8_9AGAR|nr:hypothetical protein CVT26_006298 [Gymnopilus dilepis]
MPPLSGGSGCSSSPIPQEYASPQNMGNNYLSKPPVREPSPATGFMNVAHASIGIPPLRCLLLRMPSLKV